MNPPTSLRLRISSAPPPTLPRMPDRPRNEPKSTPSPTFPSPPPSISLDTTLAKRARRARKLNTSPSVLTSAANLSSSLTCAQTSHAVVQALQATQSFLHLEDQIAILERQEALDDAGGLAAAVEVIGQFHETPAVQEAGLSLLASLKFCAAAPLCAFTPEVAETVVVALNTHARSKDVVVKGLQALCALTRLDDVRNRVLPQVRAIPVVVNCLAHWQHEPNVVEEVARFLATAAVRCESNKTEIACNGALDGLGTAVRNARSGTLTAQWCAAVRNVTVRRSDVVRKVGDMGCVEQIMVALKNYGGAEETASHALAALYHLVVGERHNSMRLVSWEGWESVLYKTAKVHLDRWKVQTLVFGITTLTVREGEQAMAMVNVGMVPLVLDAMHRHVTKRGLLFYGAKCVRSLLLATEQGMEQLTQSGGILRLLDLLYCSVARPVSDTAEHCAGYTEVL